MISSKELLEETGISRATLNNYITLGLIPKPEVRPSISGGRATRMGFFPTTTLNTVEQINAMKVGGHSMAEIRSTLGAPQNTPQMSSPTAPAPATTQPSARKHAPTSEIKVMSQEVIQNETVSNPILPGGAPFDFGAEGMKLTLDQVKHPAYLVNPMFELEWHNEAAKELVLGDGKKLSMDIKERNLFALLMSKTAHVRGTDGYSDMLSFHLSVAKNRIQRRQILNLDADLEDEDLDHLAALYDETEAVSAERVFHAQINLGNNGEKDSWYNVYVSFFREGIFFTYSPIEAVEDELMALLARRDVVIKDLLKKRRPYLTPLSVLVADLQGSVKICAELPPEEYFELINDIWTAMEPKLRKYYATHGKHVGDGMVYYFFPQPDCNYVVNAIRCAQEMKETMAEISKAWKKRKNWLNDLQLNIGLVEGQEWFGTYQTPTHIEFTVLGDSINQAGRLSDFALDGSVWITKAMLSQVPAKDKASVHYGIRRKDDHGQDMLIPETFSRVANLVDLDNPKYDKFRDIAVLPVAEVFDVDMEKK